MAEAIEMPKHNRDTDGYDLPNKEAGLLVVIAVERASEYATGPAAQRTSRLWAALDFTRRKYGLPKHIGAINLTCNWAHCQCFPLRDCSLVCGGVSPKMKGKRQQFLLGEMRAHLQLVRRTSNGVVEVWHRTARCGTPQSVANAVSPAVRSEKTEAAATPSKPRMV